MIPRVAMSWLREMLASDYARADRFYEGDSGRLEAIEHQAHCHRALADGRRHALDRSAANIADAKDPGPARLKQQWHVLHALELRHRKVGTREHEAVVVHGELTVEPVGARCRADKDEQSVHCEG